MAVEDVRKSVNDLCASTEALLQNICGVKFYNDAKKFAVKHPFLFSAAVSISVLSLVPLLFFLGFAVITLFIALLCFLCIEGSIIAIGGIIFIGVVCFISVIVLAFLSAAAAAYMILKYIRILLYSSTLTRNTEFIVINNEEKTD